MCAKRPAADLRVIFQELLNRAITQGRRMPIHGTGLGPDTWAAIDMVAREHPYATASSPTPWATTKLQQRGLAARPAPVPPSAGAPGPGTHPGSGPPFGGRNP
jgi:hypothetical protein